MGIITNKYKESHYIEKYGFKFNSHPCSRSILGYLKIYSVEIYYVWVLVDFANLQVYIYTEYDCGGEINSTNIEIPNYINIDSENEFISWLDEEITDYINIFV